jgi:hypothetical protein
MRSGLESGVRFASVLVDHPTWFEQERSERQGHQKKAAQQSS